MYLAGRDFPSVTITLDLFIKCFECFSSLSLKHIKKYLSSLQLKDTVLNDDDIGDSCHEDFLHK